MDKDPMNQHELSQLSDQELLDETRKCKPSPLIDAFLIGFLVGIVIYSIDLNSWGLVTLVPLLLIYLFLKKPKRYQALQKELNNRNLL